ncbi:hypothetical protein IGI04_002798, partial [Brassica rapa subsp. trilocularis]
MGTLVGHIIPFFFFFALGLWHLFDHIKLFSLHSKSYISCSSLFFYVCGSLPGQKNHQPFDPNQWLIGRQYVINLIVALAFAQQLFLFHFHSSDNTGVDCHYHLLLQLV